MLRCVAALFLALVAQPCRAQGVWLDVPFIKQEKNGCGAASIAMVMQYWQLQQGQPARADAGSIQRLLYSPEARGIHASRMESFFRESGFQTFAIEARWSDLKEHLQKGRPLIVALKPGGGDLHYVVVTGMDWQRGLVLTHDASRRQLLKQHRAEFEKQWRGAGNWALLALPPRTP